MKRLNIYDFEPEAVVVDAGDFPTLEFALGMLTRCKRVVCCDGAANRYMEEVGMPWRIVGDCDSLSAECREKYRHIIRRIAEQDTNDQTKAVTYLSDRGFKRIAILGATGKREDHTIGNISLLMEYARKGLDVRIYSDYGVFVPMRDEIVIEPEAGQQISLFNFGANGIKAEGLRYPLYDFRQWWEGTLNEAAGSEVRIECDGEMLVYVAFEKK